MKYTKRLRGGRHMKTKSGVYRRLFAILMAVALFCSIATPVQAASEISFKDVAEDAWYYDYVIKVVENRIFNVFKKTLKIFVLSLAIRFFSSSSSSFNRMTSLISASLILASSIFRYVCVVLPSSIMTFVPQY